MKEKLVPCLIAGAILGLVLWLASGMLWLLPVGLAAGLLGYPHRRARHFTVRHHMASCKRHRLEGVFGAKNAMCTT